MFIKRSKIGDMLYRLMLRMKTQRMRCVFWWMLRKLAVVHLLDDASYFKLKMLALTGEAFASPADGGGVNSALLWQHLYWESELPKKCCDKFAVREHVRKIVGDKYLVPLLPTEGSCWTDADDVPFDRFPNGFVLKCNNGSGMNAIVRDKDKANVPALRSKMRRWLRTDFARSGRESQYAGMRNRIICEQLLTGDDGEAPMDYKIMCSDGTPLFAWVDFGRFSKHGRNVYTPQWEFCDVQIGAYPPDAKKVFAKPENWDEMLQVAGLLSKGIPIIRIDLYTVGGRVYFGEMTFTSGRMTLKFSPFSFSSAMARKISIPNHVGREEWR